MSRQHLIQRVCVRVLFFVAIALLVIPATHLQAQTVTGTINGTVLDATGSVVPNADVVVTNQDTGVARTVTSSADGLYSVPSLLAGQYTVEARAQGFAPAQVKNVTVNVGSEARADLRLQVGSTTQTVTVSESIPTVETTSVDVSQVMDQDLIKSIPLNARDLQQLAVIQPSVQMVYTGSYGKTLTVGGDRVSNNRFLQEGIDMTTTFRQSPVSIASNILMGADAVKEFKVITENPPVEYGEESGGVINTIFKSGTNQFHGTVFEYYRNGIFDARNFFDGAKVPELHRHQFGGSLGGPIRKDKTFFFANYEGYHADTAQSFVAPVPDAAARGTGNGFGILPCATGSGPAVITGTQTCASGTAAPPVAIGQPVQVPVNSHIYNTFFGGYSGNPGIPLLPACDPGSEVKTSAGLNTGTCTLVTNPVQPVRENYGLVKLDHSLNSKNSLSGTYNMDQSTSYTPTQTNITADDIYFRQQTGSVQETFIISPNVVNTFRFGVHRLYYAGNIDLTAGTGGLSKIDPDIYVNPNPIIVDHSPYPQIPSIAVTGIQTIGATVTSSANFAPRFIGYTSGNLNDDVNWLKGKHAMQFGFQLHRWYDNNENYMNTPRGAYTFSNLASFLNGGPASSFAWWINNYTNANVGGQTYNTSFARGEQLMAYGVYAEDTYKFKSNLTLTYGLRWEYASGPNEEHNRVSNLWGPGNPPSCNPYTCATPTVGAPWYHPPRDNFAPRVGFNWDPFKKGTTSIRGGAGVFFQEVEDSFWYPSVAAQPPFVDSVSLNAGTPGGAVSFPFINVGTPGSGSGSNSALNNFLTAQGASTSGISFGGVESTYFKTATKYGYNLAIQHELPQHMTVLVSYVGSQGRHLGRTMSWQDYFPTTVETPGQVPTLNGVPIPGAAINPHCTAAGQNACNYWAGGLNTLNNVNLLTAAAAGGNPAGSLVPFQTVCAADKIITAGKIGTAGSCYNNPNWGSGITGQVSDANSFYNSLQATLERRMSPGLLVRFNYTYARCIADSGFDQPTSLSNGGSAAWPLIYQSNAARGRCNFLGTNSSNLTLNYASHWGNNINSKALKMIATNWEITSQTIVQSGLPFGIIDGANVARYAATTNSAGTDRPNWAAPSAACPDPSAHGAVNANWKSNLTYLNAACFAPAVQGYLGDVGNLVFTAPNLINTDVSVRKTIRINESKSFVISADMFNAFNRTNFLPPASSSLWTTTGITNYEAGTGTLAQAVSATFSKVGQSAAFPTVTTSRQFQINGRFNF